MILTDGRESSKRKKEAGPRKEKIMSKDQIKKIVEKIYTNRKERSVHPEGAFDKAGRWYPSKAEDIEITNRIRTPSRAWPYSYMTACRTKKHCKALVLAAIEGASVPHDVARAIEQTA